MAKKKIPLSKPTGSDGEGNIKNTSGPMTLDLGDFDDMFGAAKDDAPTKGPLGQFYSGMKDSFKDRLKTKDLVRNFLRSAAPDGISNVMGLANDALHASRDIKESLERTNPGDLQYIAKKAQALLPSLQDYVSDDTYNKISEGLENKIDEYDYTIQSKRDQTAIRRAAQQQSDENEIKEAIDNISLTERLNHNRSEQAANARHQQNRAENSVRDLLRTKRFDYVARSMGVMADSLQRISGYNEQVNYGFQRKGLELQLRTYVGIKELIKLQEANLELNARAYNALVRNTAIPDHQKGQNGQLMNIGRETNNNSFINKAVSRMGGRTLNQFLGNYGNDVQGRITNSLSQKLSMGVGAAQMGSAVGMGDLWKNRYSMAGNLAGDWLGDFVLNDLIPTLGREARPGLTKLSDRYGGRHNQAGYLADNIPAYLQEFVNNGQNQHGIRGKLSKLISPYVPQFGLQDRLTKGTFQTIDQPMAFNQATQRSIVDGIPGYLARMLQEMRMIRTGSNDVAREVYNMASGTFTTESSAHSAIQDRILPKASIRSASTVVNDALNTMDSDGRLSADARKALSERMMRDSANNKRFDPEAYIRTRGYADGTSPEVAAELESFFRGKFQFDDAGKMSDSSDNHKLRQEFSKVFLDIRSVTRDPIKEIERLIDTGHTEPLRAMGIIITENNQEKINYPRIWEILRSGVTSNNPFAANGDGVDPYRDDMSGTAGHRDFMGPVNPGRKAAFVQRFTRAATGKMNLDINDLHDQAVDSYTRNRESINRYTDMVSGRYTQAKAGLGGMTATGLSAYDNLKSGGFKAFVGDKQDRLKGYAVSGMEKLTDLYSSFDPTQPLIKGIDFSLGDLIDVNTKKIITNPKDITGEVINNLGQTVVTAAEAAHGLLAPDGEVVVKTTMDASERIQQALDRNRNTVNESVNAQPQETVDDNQDWSLDPGGAPTITARGLKNGEYLDAAGKVVRSLADISSDIFDKAGNLVMSTKEAANGLWSTRSGRKYRPTKGFARLMRLVAAGGKYSGQTATQLGFTAIKFGAKAALGMATTAFNFVVSNQNAYLPDEPIPVITRRALQNGEYYDSNGKVVKDFVDVYSPMFNAQGEPVIAPELYRQLTNFDGSKHVLAKNKGIWAKFVMRPVRAMKSAYANLTKRYYKWLGGATVKVGGWLGRKTLGGFAKLGSTAFNRMFERVEDPNVKAQIDATVMTGQQQSAVMEQVLEAVRDLKPKTLRKGSWQEQQTRPGKTGNPLADAVKSGKDDEGGLLKRGLNGLAKMLGLGGGKGGDDDDDGFGLDDAADVADIADSVRGRGGRAGKKVGRLARMGRWLKGSRLGRMAGAAGEWLGKSRVGQMVGSLGTRIAGSAAGKAGLNAISQVAKRPTLYTAIAAAAYGMGSYLWSSISDTQGQFRRLRLAQYGIRGMRRELKILNLEAAFDKATDRTSDNPSLNIQGVGAEQMLDIMGIDKENTAEVQNFAKWLDLRFKPIFLAYVSGMNKIGQAGVAINEIDDKVPKELKADLLESVKFSYDGDTPYAVLINPFDPDDRVESNSEQISAMFDQLRAEYVKERKDDPDQVVGVDGKPISAEAAKTAAVAGAAAGVATTAKDIVKQQADLKDQQADVMTSPLAKIGAGAGSMSGTIANLNEKIGNSLTALQSIRMRAYGLQTLQIASVKALLALEAEYAKDLTAVDDVVDYTGDEGKLLSVAGQLLGKDTSVGSNDRPVLYNWLTQRFAPAFRAYYGAAKQANPGADLRSLESKLTASDKVTVGAAVLGAIYRHDQTVWESPSIFPVKGPLIDLKRMADADLDHLKDLAAKAVVDTPTQKGSDQMEGNNAADQGGSFTDRVVGTIKNAWNNTTETVSTTWSRTKDAVVDKAASAKMAIGLGADYGEGGAVGGTIKSTGTSGTMLTGTGGQFEQLPYPTASGSIKAAYPTLEAAAKMTGVPVDWAVVIAGIESGFKYDVKSPTSSATGWFQFIDSTWDSMVNKYGAKYGIPDLKSDPTRSARKDPRCNALMGCEYIRENYEYLSSKLGRTDLTDTDVYMAHFLGAGGAVTFFKADPNAMAYKVFPKQYSANMPLFFVDARPSQPRTIAEVYKLFQAKMDKFWSTVGKGYKKGTDDSASSSNTPAAQTPGVEATKSPDDELKDKLASDASSKDGVAAEAGGGPSAPTSSDPASVGDPSAGGGSVQAMARNTAPMPGAPSGGGGASTSSSGGSTDSGANYADQQQQAQVDAAQAQNTRRAAAMKRDQQVASDVNDIQTQQLNTLFEIRDLMRNQVDSTNDLNTLLSKGVGNSANGGGSGNNMNTSNIQGRPAASRQSAVTLR